MASGRQRKQDPAEKLEQYLDTLIEDDIFRSRSEVARGCGLTETGLIKVLREPGRRLSVEQCLRLALTIDERPTVILRKAGRDEAAEVLDDLWPKERNKVELTRNEKEVVGLWRSMTTKERNHVRGIMALFCVSRELAPTAGLNGQKRSASPRSRKPSRPAPSR